MPPRGDAATGGAQVWLVEGQMRCSRAGLARGGAEGNIPMPPPGRRQVGSAMGLGETLTRPAAGNTFGPGAFYLP